MGAHAKMGSTSTDVTALRVLAGKIARRKSTRPITFGWKISSGKNAENTIATRKPTMVAVTWSATMWLAIMMGRTVLEA